jgi:selenide,water dikinase
MLRASGVGARIELAALPALPGALALLARGVRSTFHAQNECAGAVACRDGSESDPAAALLFDPQTSGGLLFGVAAERADAALSALRRGGDPDAARIGEVVAAGGEARIELVRGAQLAARRSGNSP